MANTVQNGQTCLEKRGMAERGVEIERSDYNINDQYWYTHKDAISDGDVQGKGHPTIKGHSHWLPDCTKPTGYIDYSNFATSPEQQIGGCLDIKGYAGRPGREEQMARSIYKYTDQYGPPSVDTSANQADGQYVVKLNLKEGIICE